MDVGDVAAHVGLDRGIDEGRHRSLVLPVLPKHLAADRDDGLGVLVAQHLAHRPLVRVVGVGVEEADADRRDALAAEPAGRGDGPLLVEGVHLPPLEVHPPSDGAHTVGRHDARGLDPEVGVPVSVGHGLPRDLEDELVALGRDEAELLDLALEELVRGDGGAVADRAEVGARGAEHVEDLLDPGDETVSGVARRAGGLRRRQVTGVLVEGHDVGEGAAGVDADPDASVRALRHGDDSTGPGPGFRWQILPIGYPGSSDSRPHPIRPVPLSELHVGWAVLQGAPPIPGPRPFRRGAGADLRRGRLSRAGRSSSRGTRARPGGCG